MERGIADDQVFYLSKTTFDMMTKTPPCINVFHPFAVKSPWTGLHEIVPPGLISRTLSTVPNFILNQFTGFVSGGDRIVIAIGRGLSLGYVI